MYGFIDFLRLKNTKAHIAKDAMYRAHLLLKTYAATHKQREREKTQSSVNSPSKIDIIL